ncbi:MAG: hypothetical protein COB03_02330 [Alteromonas sp.]|jgi:2-polyprenyl-3-methyl-5-hydroxy-6-metoxy-1,4-benzoquinol methylase|nr:MAG: hypothetical protein COB03_02330 [Alteromonas sp.]|tara:strand:- start:2326 stop:3600 length:1275 start_codon:yes stop_codon:yes gene_type:complete
MLSERFNNDNVARLTLKDAQLAARIEYLSQVALGNYQFESVTCECGSSNLEVLAKKDRYAIPIITQICKSCGQIFTSPRLNETSTSDFYANLYRKLYVGAASADEQFFNRQVRHGNKILRYLSDVIEPNKGSVLEIGCGAGGILKPLEEAGYSCVGVDLGDTYLDMGRQFGLDLHCMSSQRLAETTSKKFDLIILSHVFEHFLDIEKELDTVSSLLTKRGHLYIEVPGLFNLRNTYDSDFLKYLQNAHNYHFNLALLKRVLAKYGFSFVKGNEDVQAVFKKDDHPATCNVNQYPSIRAYLDDLERKREYYARQQSENAELAIRQRFSNLDVKLSNFPDKSVSLYGTGQHTKQLLSYITQTIKVKNIISPNAKEHGNTMENLSIVALESSLPRAIVISSNSYQETILRRISYLESSGVEIICLYE